MNNENHNPHIIPGRPTYNPQAQTFAGANDYLNSIYPGHIDPTQMPIKPGDTERAMHEHPSRFSYAQIGTENTQQSPSFQNLNPARQILEELRREMAESLYKLNSPIPQNVYRETLPATIKNQPITIDINLNINLNIRTNNEQD